MQLLREFGITNAIEIDGGYAALVAAGLPLTSDQKGLINRDRLSNHEFFS